MLEYESVSCACLVGAPLPAEHHESGSPVAEDRGSVGPRSGPEPQTLLEGIQSPDRREEREERKVSRVKSHLCRTLRWMILSAGRK